MNLKENNDVHNNLIVSSGIQFSSHDVYNNFSKSFFLIIFQNFIQKEEEN